MAAAAASTTSSGLPVVFSTVPPCKTSVATNGGGLLRMKETARKPSALLAKSAPRVLAAAASPASADTTGSNVEGDGGNSSAGDQVKTSRYDDDEGEMVAVGAVYRQGLRMRSYEVSADGKASVPTLMNHLQDTSLNQIKCWGLMGDDFGATPEMCKRSLVWVVTKMCLQIHTYASWGTSVNVDTWMNSMPSKNLICRVWQVCDKETGQILYRATGIWVMMNKHTRRMRKNPQHVRDELQPYFRDHIIALSIDDTAKFDMPDQHSTSYAHKSLLGVCLLLDQVKTQILKQSHFSTALIFMFLLHPTTSWNDLDCNQHVNYVKYVSWIFESIPDWILKNYEAMSISLEYHKECNIGNMLQSFTTVSTPSASHNPTIECQHALQLESGSIIIKGRTIWRLKQLDRISHNNEPT